MRTRIGIDPVTGSDIIIDTGMDDKTRSELEALVRSKLGAALVRIRWDQTTAAERSDHARMMARARWGENRPRKRSKPKPK